MNFISKSKWWCVCVVYLGIVGAALMGMQPSKNINALSLRELWQRRIELDGQIIRVRGFYVLEPPISALYESRQAFDNDTHPLSLWIGVNKPSSAGEKNKRAHLVDVVIEGRFNNQSAGVFDQFFAQLEDITSFSVLEDRK